MSSKTLGARLFAAVSLLFALNRAALAADAFQLGTTLHPSPGVIPIVLDLSTTGPEPSASDLAAYQDPANWRILMQTKPTDPPVSLCDDRQPTGVVRKPCLSNIELSGTQHLLLHLTGTGLPEGDGRDHLWTVLFQPPAGMAALPVLASFTTPIKSVSSNPAPGKSAAPAKTGYFAPIGSGDTPDYSLSGTFLAGGNTKPIYTLVEQASFYATKQWGVLGLPGFTSAVAINQAAAPPNNRTRLDPNSISAAVSFWRLDPVSGGGLLYGLITQINPLGGEFSRSDPSANIIGGFNTTFVLQRKRLSDSAYFVLYPLAGLEGGRNLDKPASIMGTAADLSHYSGIFRGLLGSDAVFSVVNTKDKDANVFSITGSYRMRLPAADEPRVRTVHGTTLVDLTTRARNWIEVDINASPWSFKYLSLNAKYQYGSLPPLFSLVDQQVSFGFTIQGKQANKKAATSLPH